MTKLAALAALGLAGGLLALQILLGLEYTAGGTLGTQASMIAAMITLAALPVFIEVARRQGQAGIAGALFVAFVAFLAYSLPATTGRTGEIKETKVAAAEAVSRVADDLKQTKATLHWAEKDMIAECGTGEGPKCRAKRNTVEALQARAQKLEGDLKKAAPQATGDMGSDLWAWATGASAATVRKVSVLAFAVGLDVVIWSLIWFATVSLGTTRKAVNDNALKFADFEPLPPARQIEPEIKGRTVIEWARHFEAKHGRKPRLDETQAAWPMVSRSTCYRRLKAA